MYVNIWWKTKHMQDVAIKSVNREFNLYNAKRAK
jgi:hypothetical protein